LAVEIGNVDGVEVDYLDVTEAGEGQVFEEFAADAAGSDEEDAGGEDFGEEG
jgi:hypothetical protein